MPVAVAMSSGPRPHRLRGCFLLSASVLGAGLILYFSSVTVWSVRSSRSSYPSKPTSKGWLLPGHSGDGWEEGTNTIEAEVSIALNLERGVAHPSRRKTPANPRVRIIRLPNIRHASGYLPNSTRPPPPRHASEPPPPPPPQVEKANITGTEAAAAKTGDSRPDGSQVEDSKKAEPETASKPEDSSKDESEKDEVKKDETSDSKPGKEDKELLVGLLRDHKRKIGSMVFARGLPASATGVGGTPVTQAKVENEALLATKTLEQHVRAASKGRREGRALPAPNRHSSNASHSPFDSAAAFRPKDKQGAWGGGGGFLEALRSGLGRLWPWKSSSPEDEDSLAEGSSVPLRHWPQDECATLLGFPKVAMMFLSKGDLHHSNTWELWFEFAHGKLPRAPVCERPGGVDAAQTACRARDTGSKGDVIANQQLFSVYVHVGLSSKEFKGFGPDSLWHGRAIKHIATEWGQHTLVTATRNLLREALKEPANRKFVLLSEAAIPLYPPMTAYVQLMVEEKSRLNACTEVTWERHNHRWTDRMETVNMNRKHWRKSSQWFALTREHAEIVVADTEINRAFHDHCYPTEEEGWWRDCFSDEHYFATLLAVLGRENETDCKGFMMHVDWRGGGAHPRAYNHREISPTRFRMMRLPHEKCKYPTAIQSASAQFVRVEGLNATTSCAAVEPYKQTLGPQCPLFARKFSEDTAEHITRLISHCNNRLRIVHDADC